MIPLGDESRRLQHFPTATVIIIALNVVVFLLELTSDDASVTQWAVVPAEISAGKNLITILTAMFMHGGWLHIVGNMVFLWAFGPEIEDAMGPRRYTIFYLGGGVVATYAQILLDPTSTIPNLGASGAIAAVMGAFLVTYPNDRICTVLVFGFFIRVTFMPAALLIGIWFLIQFISLSMVANTHSGGVAYMAHVGGLIFGAVTAHLFEYRRRPRGPWDVD